MKIWAPIFLTTLAAIAAGCQSQQKPPPQTSASVLDVSGPSARSPGSQQPVNSYQPAPQYAPPPAHATTTTPPYRLPSAYPPPEPIPAAVVETHAPQQQVAAAPPPEAPARTRNAPKSAPPVADGATASAGSRYTVKQGDTLYHIAKVSYGDGKQWQRIASANPGISPTSLKVGQVLVVP